MKTIFSFLIASFLFIQLTYSQAVELIGIGVKDVNPSTLFISDPSTVDSVIVEATGWYLTFLGDPDPGNVLFFDANENYEVGYNEVEQILTPSWLGENKAVYFRATFNDVDAGGITLNNIGQEAFISSFTAYVYRNQADPNIYYNVEFDHASVFLTTAARPLAYNFVVPETEQPRDIQVELPISELSDDGRYAIISLSAGTDTVHLEFDSNNVGRLLNLQTIALNNVPGNITSINLEIYSPLENVDGKPGDSFITGPILVKSEVNECGECEGQITYLELEYLGQNVDSITIYKDKVQSDKILATFYNVIKGDVLAFAGVGKDNKMGAKIRLVVNDNDDYTEIHTSCSQDIYAGMTYDKKYLILYGTSHEGGELCYKPNEEEDDECGECEGQITYLELEYTGNETNATVKIYSNKVQDDNLIVTFENINNGDLLDFSGYGKDNKMGPKIRLVVNEEDYYTEIHTSCSQEIYAGMSFDNRFLILYGTSHEGGELCYKEKNIETEQEVIKENDKKKEETNDESNTKKNDSISLKYTNVITDVSCSPNPVQSKAIISFTSSIKGNAKVDIFDSRGKKKGTLYNKNVISDVPVNIEFDSHRYKKGVYIIIITIGNNKESIEILIDN